MTEATGTWLSNHSTGALQKADKNWVVGDLFVSAFLSAVGQFLMGIEQHDGSRVFLFYDSDSLEADYERFKRGDSIGIRVYVDSVYRLKKLLREYDDRNRRT